MARRIRIKRNRRPEVLRNAGQKLPQPSYGAGVEEPVKQHWCMWCYYPKKASIDKKCECCGKLGATSTPQREISQVYLEDNPVFLESR